MRVVVLYNPRSGRGRAAGAARRFADGLSGFGHDAALLEAGAGGLGAAVRGTDALVVAGGDGTLHHAVVELVNGMDGGGPDLPGLYHVPLGTENLFARHFGMTDDPAALDAALRAGNARALDIGLCNGRPFLLMCGVGPDAAILARLDAAGARGGTRGAISHRSYLRPIVSEIIGAGAPALTVSVDGREVVRNKAGLLVVANCPQYAMGLNPAVRASMSDGVLDAVFFPARWKLLLAGWAVAARLGWHTRLRSLVYRTGTVVEVSTGGRPAAYQLDGEAFVSADGRLLISVHAAALRVWAPRPGGKVRAGGCPPRPAAP